MGFVFLAPRTTSDLAPWPAPLRLSATIAGSVLAIAGVALLLAALIRLGSGLTPMPYPKANATLVQTGPYRFVRHPMYAGGIAIAYGWAFLVHGWLTLFYASALLVFLEIKATREERWLVEKFPGYPEYQRRVRKLIPFIH
jgi:protein-S-isoprenylcysteine O-methyltransferase Ste14